MRQLIILLCLLSFLPSAFSIERMAVNGIRENQRGVDWDSLTGGGGGYGGGGGRVGGGGGGRVPADAVLTPAEKAEKDAEYDDLKQRSKTPPQQLPNE